MAIFRHQLTDADIIEEPDETQYVTGNQNIPPEWYVLNLSSHTVHFATYSCNCEVIFLHLVQTAIDDMNICIFRLSG